MVSFPHRKKIPSPGRAPRCPQCRGRMECSLTSVMLPAGSQVLPPVWLCRRCWVVLPPQGDDLRLVPLRSAPTRRTA